jgi:hypothetical protein
MRPSGSGPPPERPERARPKPPPAREAGGSPPEGRRPRRDRARGPRRGSKRPTPARSLSTPAEATPRGRGAVEERSVEIEGEAWRVRVLGRSRAGRTGAAAELILLGFWPDGSTAESPEREALVVGDGSDALGPAQMSRAMAVARTPPDPERSKPFFEDRRRGRRG